MASWLVWVKVLRGKLLHLTGGHRPSRQRVVVEMRPCELGHSRAPFHCRGCGRHSALSVVGIEDRELRNVWALLMMRGELLLPVGEGEMKAHEALTARLAVTSWHWVMVQHCPRVTLQQPAGAVDL